MTSLSPEAAELRRDTVRNRLGGASGAASCSTPR